MWQFAIIFFLITIIIVKKIWGAPPCGIAAFLLFSGLYSPQVFTLPVVLTLIGPASLPVFPRIFEALFFDLSVFFKCFKVIIPCKSAAVSLTSSLTPLVLSYRQPEVYLRCARDRWVLTAGSLHIIVCKAFSALRAFDRYVLTAGSLHIIICEAFICAARA